MHIGLVYPQTEYPSDPIAIKDYAQNAEELGFSHVLAYDHVLGANPERPGGWMGPYTYRHSFQSPLLLFSYMAAVTKDLGFATGIIILPQRQTALFAKQAATLDVLCGGQLRLGVAIGWNPVEYHALNQDFNTRGSRLEEQVSVLRELWTKPLVTFEGRWDSIADAGINPLPVQRPIPIWFGGHAEAVLERVARLGDGWMPNYRKASDAQPALDTINRTLAEVGRSQNEIGLEARLVYGDGNPEAWQKTLDEWGATGATHMSFNTMGAGFKSPQEHLNAIRFFAEVIGLV